MFTQFDVESHFDGKLKIAFLNKLVTQFAITAIAQGDFNTGLFGEAVHP